MRWWAYTKLATTSEIFSTRGSLNLNVVNFHRWICHLAPSRLHLDVSTNVSSSSPLTPRHSSSTSAHLSSRVGHTLNRLPRISATYSRRTADCGGKFLSLAFFSFVPNKFLALSRESSIGRTKNNSRSLFLDFI